jgi:hypothetical protein
MSCGCKNKNQTTNKILPKTVIHSDGGIEIIDVSIPSYTREDVIRIKDYTISSNKTEIERQFVADILYTSFGDLIPDYCDIPCINHVKNRAEYMEKRLFDYENFIKI